ncbi:hypothetical protein A1O1_07387 [Capronia coronata CBS 617.96]|uniref:DUF7053 domain-containing protein n=1 Tax=Capronia coronata CBS 617.96 TaxID=1182541 RepID=W9Y3E4_9EURO|nr:uncharacterized protein A1O1_07387 [Capronia coronata CBS 617.96]EXJ83761.1 hypothetical protein A1O1_07387 [Capronia coronata CBS 617.96]
MKKKSVYANITPIPSHIPRQLAIDMLHSHGEIIQLNPLVIGWTPVKAPQNAPADEYFSTWYEIAERIQYVPGMGRMGSGKISFKGVFHDMPWGLQTHVYAPMGVDVRNKWQIRGNQPGEPPESRELGSGAPAEGLYMREDIEIKCNPAMISFVKKELKAASKIMVDRLVKKAELIDSGQLSAMMEDGKLKTINPADRSQMFQSHSGAGHYSPSLLSPNLQQQHIPPPPMSPGYQYSSPYARQSQYGSSNSNRNSNNNSPGFPPPQGLAIEMPGSTPYDLPEQPSRLPLPNRFSAAVSELSATSPNQSLFPNNTSNSTNLNHSSTSDRDRLSYAGSVSSHPSSHDQGQGGGMASPGLDKRSFMPELPAGGGYLTKHSPNIPYRSPGSTPDPNSSPPVQQYRYNPQDYARMS